MFVILFCILIIFSCETNHGNKAINLVAETNKKTARQVDYYAFDAKFLSYMPDTLLSFKNLNEVTKYNFNLGRKLKEYTDSIYYACKNKDSAILQIRSAEIQFNNLQEFLVFRQLKKEPKNNRSMNLLSFFSPYSRSIGLQERKELYNSFPSEIKNNETGLKTLDKINQYSFEKNLGKNINEYASSSINNPILEQLKFGDLIKENDQYYIMVFGASWCQPCRVDEKQLKYWIPLLDTTKIKIIGFSIDTDVIKWQKYLQEEKLPWESYLLPKDMDHPIITDLHFKAVPMNFLVSNNGQIMAQNTDIRKVLLEIKSVQP